MSAGTGASSTKRCRLGPEPSTALHQEGRQGRYRRHSQTRLPAQHETRSESGLDWPAPTGSATELWRVWAQEAQVDWYEAWVDLGDKRTRVQAFAMRSMASGAAFQQFGRVAVQQATACRGALDGFIAEVIEDHIREHLVQEKERSRATKAAEELIRIVHSYLT